jgi:L-ascorbate metabolism protein UlaG (beta-lactamase superfamily)
LSNETLVTSELELTGLLDNRRRPAAVELSWLGQAGFLIRSGNTTVVIDAYLSDVLAEKYRGTKFPHTRLMTPPIQPEELTPIDIVLCTHAHTDHMDPGTLPILAQRNPDAQFVVPLAARQMALDRGVPAERLIAGNADDEFSVSGGCTVRAIAAAHEQFLRDQQGNHHYLGYVIRLHGHAIYHSGDCVPYAGLAEKLAACHLDLALLPINGRDEYRRQHGVPGNFTFAEAAELCQQASIPAMIACHFGMFAFNTVSPMWLDRQLANMVDSLHGIRPIPGQVYELCIGK